MRRGEVYDARRDPVEGSEQAGFRPVVIVSRDTLNDVRGTSAADDQRRIPTVVCRGP